MHSRLAVAGCFTAATIVAALTSCGATNSTNTASPTATPGNATSTPESGDVTNSIPYGSDGTTANIDCAKGDSLEVDGSNNTLTVSGNCATVRVSGTNNNITIDAVVDELNVPGAGNTVTATNDANIGGLFVTGEGSNFSGGGISVEGGE